MQSCIYYLRPLLPPFCRLIGAGPCVDVSRIRINPSRADRVEPRVRKRRPKQFPLMKEPRAVLRKRLMGKEVAAY